MKIMFRVNRPLSFQGTARRIQYTFNNTAIGGYQPPPCFMDWPDGTLTGTLNWIIGHCPNLVPILLNTIFPILHIFVTVFSQICVDFFRNL
jgi:hypothetical protein